jgi:hypothetical protein|tara:strand:+ start:28286 stop:29860 length:1575 start_codon:yes stop_codon:yes gene_type:complete
MRTYFCFLFFLFLSSAVCAKSLHITNVHISSYESLNIEVVNTSSSEASLNVSYPSSELKTLAEIATQEKKIITFSPREVGQYIFYINEDFHTLWVHKKPSVNITMSKVFVPNLPIHFDIPQEYRDQNYQYDWRIFYNDTKTFVSSESGFDFLPLLKGNYSLKLQVTDKRVPLNSLSTTTIYRTFEVKNRIDSFRMNLPLVVYKNELPILANVLKPFNNEFQVKWFIGQDNTSLDELTLTEDMFKEHSLRIMVKVYDDDDVIGEKSSIINIENARLKTGYISVQELPSGNIEIRSDGSGNLSIVDKKILQNSLVITDAYIVVKPIVNHSFDIFLTHEDQVLDKFVFNNAIEFYTFDFDINFLTDDNVMPSFIKFAITKINVPTDKIEHITYYINEQVMAKNNLEATAYSDLLGINTARIEVTLKTGEIIIKAKKFTLSSSTLPVCNIEYDSSIKEVWARCTDTDSYVKDYTYNIANVAVSKNNSFILPKNYNGETILFEASDALGNKGQWMFKLLEGNVVYVEGI